MSRSARNLQLGSVLLIVITVLLVMGRLTAYEFTNWDDDSTVYQNSRMNPPTLKNTLYYWGHSAGSLYVPVTYTVWSILAAAARLETPDANNAMLNPMVFHLANILVHCGSAALVYVILNRLTRNRVAATIGALLYAIHPVQVESVAWISGMKDLLWGFFGLLAIDQYIALVQLEKRAAEPKSVALSPTEERLRYAGCTVCLVLAMLSKPTAMMLPPIIVVIDWLLLGRRWRQIFSRTWLWFALLVPLMIVTRYVQQGQSVDGGPLWSRPLQVFDSLTFYLGKLVWPVGMTVDYGHRPPYVIASGMIWWTWCISLSIALIAVRQRRKRPWILAGCLIFALGTLPTLGWVPFSFQFFSTTADHYLYASMLGVGLILAYAIAQSTRPKVWINTSAVVLLLLAGRSFHQTQFWADHRTLVSHILAVGPNSFIGYFLQGQIELDAGNFETAERLLRRSLEIEPRHPRTHDSLATLLLKTNRPDEAIEHIKIFIGSSSDAHPAVRAQLADARSALGLYHFKHGEYAKAADQFRTALKYRPDDKTLQNLLRNAEEKLNNQSR